MVLDLVGRLAPLATGDTVEIALGPGDAALVAAWCARTGNEVVATGDGLAVIRRGRPAPDDPPLPPGMRLWLYTNFDCNLACDYCCVSSSPHARRRALGLDRIRRLAREAAPAGITEILLTGGEPFLLTDLDEIAAACAAALPTTLLTNGMLFRGSRLAMLRRMPRDRLTLQISLDSADPGRHDRHRGAGSWARAVAGIRTALDEGFRVRVAATVDAADTTHQDALHARLDGWGIPRGDQVIRPIAQRGVAADGVVLTAQTLLPEVTVTADGVYWHPVGAEDLDLLVRTDIFPLAEAIGEIRHQFAAHRRATRMAAERFPCA